MKVKKILLDVRTPEEFAEYSILGSIHIPVQDIVSSPDVVSLLSHFGVHKESDIVVYCASGARANVVESVLKQQGFLHVENRKSIYAIEHK